jgi:hypothetical protein
MCDGVSFGHRTASAGQAQSRYALLGTLLLLALPAVAQPGDAGGSARAQVELLNRQLARATSLSAGPGQLADLLGARARLLVQFMAADPFQVRELALPSGVLGRVRRALADPAVESNGEWTGTLEAAVEDDFEHGGSRIDWYLRTAGPRFQLHFGYTPRQRVGVAVRVGGLAIAGHIAVSGVTTQAEDAAAGAPLQCTTTGPQNIAVLMLTTPSFPSLPPGYTAASLQEAFFGSPLGAGSDTRSTSSLNGFWKEMSYGKTSAAGQVFGPFALDRDYPCDQAAQIQAAAIAAADSTVDFRQFTHIALFFPVSACPSYSGQDSVGCWQRSPECLRRLVPRCAGWFPQPGAGRS